MEFKMTLTKFDPTDILGVPLKRPDMLIIYYNSYNFLTLCFFGLYLAISDVWLKIYVEINSFFLGSY